VRRPVLVAVVAVTLTACTAHAPAPLPVAASPAPTAPRARLVVARPAAGSAAAAGTSVVVTGTGPGQVAVLRVDQTREQVRWHPGTVVPGADAWPSPPELSAAERATVVATFNGGFTNRASRGGTRAGRVTRGVLRVGAASLVIDATGHADVVRYDPVRDAASAVVRQNLDLLLSDGRPATTVGQDDTPVWGRTLHRRHATWRSAVGIARDGSLLVVLAAHATTRQLAADVQRAGAVRAMELDINPQFTCLLTYSHAGGQVVPHAVLARQQGSASRYLVPSRRDFFSVLPR
jgi:hypothetical protein